MKRLLPTILTIILALSLSGCSYYLNTKSATEKRVDIILSEAYKRYENREVVFERLTMEFTDYREEPVIITKQSRQKSSQIVSDGSRINTLVDGFGNKTETRVFFNDPLIKMVVVRTNLNGHKEAFVYAQNGEVKFVPDEMVEKILTISTIEIAKSAEIFAGRKENEFLTGLQKKQTPQTVPVKSDNEIPPQTVTETAKPNSDAKESIKEDTEKKESQEIGLKNK